MIKVVERDCDILSSISAIDEFDMNDLGNQDQLCPRLNEIGTSRPWVVRNFFDPSGIDTLAILSQNRNVPIGVFNYSDRAALNARVRSSEHGRGCTWLRSELNFQSTIGDWLDLTQQSTDENLYVSFDYQMANLVFDSLPVQRVCEHILAKTHIDAFVSRKKFNTSFPDTALHCAAESNHFFQITGSKKFTMLNPDQSPELAFFNDNLLQNAVAPSLHLVDCLPRFEVYIHPGDLLYIPPWWWHQVKNLPGDSSEGSIVFGMATRFLEIGGAIRAHPLQSLHTWFSQKFKGRISTTDAQRSLLKN